MKLRRITPAGLAELKRRLAAGEELEGIAASAGEHWSEPHPTNLEIAAVEATVAEWDASSTADAEHAVELHETLRMPRRIASDRTIWSWLAGIRFARYTQARWSSRDRTFNYQRVGTDYLRNAFGRLWWAAEQTHVEGPRALCDALDLQPSDDPYHFTRRLLRQPAVHQELTNRDELNDRAKLIAFLAFVHHERLLLADIREAAKELNLLFSTTMVAGFENPGPEAGRHRVDPAGCRKLLDYLRARLAGAAPSLPFGKPRARSKLGRVFSWLRGGAEQ